MVEMDYFDFVFSFGLIAGLALTILIAVYVFKSIKLILTELFRKDRNTEKLMLAFTGLLMLGVSLVAGHIWFAPAVSIYVAIVLAMQFNDGKIK